MEQQNVDNQNMAGPKNAQKKDDGKGSLIGGVILITLGIIFLLAIHFDNFNFRDWWPVILIIIGIFVLRNSFLKPKK